MGKQRNITPQVAKSYDDAFEAFNEVVKKGKGNTGFGSLGSAAASTFRGYDTGIGDSKYDKGLSWNANIDEDNVKGSINEFRSEQQGGWAETGAFFGRVTNKVGLELAKTAAAIVGTVGGLAGNTSDLITGKDEHDFLEITFNNDFIKAAEKISKSINEEYLPVYVSEIVENGDFLDKVTSGEFWATEGADGVGYLISAMAPGAAFKALGGAGKIFGGATKAAKYLNFEKGLEGARTTMKALGITKEGLNSIAIPALNTYFEAGAEAKGTGDAMEFKKDKYLSDLKSTPEFQNQVILKLKELDNQRRAGIITIEEQNQIASTLADDLAEKSFQDQKGKAMRNVFLTNVGILALPNYIQAKMLFGKTPSRLLLDKITGEVAEKSVKNTVKQGLKNVGKSFLSEGSEEVAQTSTEQRNVNRGLNNELEEFYLTRSKRSAEDVLTFGEDFVKSLGTTEGQVAGFLGGIMGAPMSAVGGYFQDKSDRVQTERLREKINGASTAYADIKNTNIYEQEEYTNPETGEVGFRDKEVDGKKVFIPENVAKVKKALDLIEKDSNEYDNAVEDGDIEKIEQFRNRGEFNVISNFIGEDEVTLDALHEHLKVAFPTETSKDISDEQVKVNKTNLERIDKIMSKAKSLQKDFVSFKDMSASILRINHPDITSTSTKEEKRAANEHLADFLNRTAMTFLSERAEEYEAKQDLNKLEKQRLELENNSTVVEIDNPNYIEGITSEFDKKTKTRSNNPRLELVNSLIDTVKEKLKGYEENTNSNIWNNELLNKQFTEEVKEINDIKKENTSEQIAKNDEVLNKTKNATTVDEIKEIEKTSPKEALENPIIKKAIADKKAEIIEAEKVANAEEIATATQEDNDFNDTTVYTDLTGTEGSPVTDELIPQQAENNTSEELKSIENSEVDSGLGVKVISTDRSTGLPLQFITEQFPLYLHYEREPVNKSGKEVGFEINQNPGKNPKVLEALDAFNRKDFSNPKLLIDYLPINVRFTDEVNAPIETRRSNDEINSATEILRIEIINHLINGGSINDIKTTIQDQYKGVLKVESDTAENNILQLNGVKDLKYVRDNLFVVNSQGNLQNILNGKIENFTNDKVKPNAAGEIYLMIPQANGKLFPLKLNIKKISESEAYLLYEIYKEILTNEKSLDTTLSEINDDLKEAIEKNFQAELNIIGGNKNDIKLQEIIDLLIYQSDNIKSRMQIVNDSLLFGDKESTIDTIEQDVNDIIDFLVNQKRHQIKINPKSETDNTKTNLKSNSADYLKYLVDNNILSTNAVVNEPTFQGYTNIYLNTGVTISNQPKMSEIEKRIDFTISEVFSSESLFDFSENQPGKKNKKGEFIPDNLGEQMFNAINKTVKGEVVKTDKIEAEKLFKQLAKEVHPDKHSSENIKLIAEQFFKAMNIAKEKGRVDILNELKLKYDAELAVLNQPKVSESGVEVKTDNTGLGSLFENNSQNVRNSQENFVPLSEIPGTVENTELKETQEKVINKKRTPKERQTDFRRMDALFKKKSEKGLTTEKELRDFEMFKEMYPQEFEKRCK